MEDCEVKFFNDPHSLEYSTHETIGGASGAMCGVLDQYKELLQDENITGVTMQLLYKTKEGTVALERMVMTQNPLGEGVGPYNVHADGLVVEPIDSGTGANLYNRLAHLSWLAMSDIDDSVDGEDDGDYADRKQNFWHDASHQTVDLYKQNS